MNKIMSIYKELNKITINIKNYDIHELTEKEVKESTFKEIKKPKINLTHKNARRYLLAFYFSINIQIILILIYILRYSFLSFLLTIVK